MLEGSTKPEFFYHSLKGYVKGMLNEKLALMHNICNIRNKTTLLKVNQSEKYTFGSLLLAMFVHFVHL